MVNAAGPFADTLRGMDESHLAPSVVLSRGAHIVVSSAFLPGRTALLVPSTDDGRILFAIPWHGHVLIGTTDVPVAEPSHEPVPSAAEVDYLIDHAGRYLTRPRRARRHPLGLGRTARVSWRPAAARTRRRSLAATASRSPGGAS